MSEGKDTPEVVQFLDLFARLKPHCDDRPDRLPDLARAKQDIRELCLTLYWCVQDLKAGERRDRRLFAAPTNPDFRQAWRDFEDRYDDVLEQLMLEHWLQIGLTTGTDGQSRFNRRWDAAELLAKADAEKMAEALDFAEFVVSNSTDGHYDANQMEDCADGLQSWRALIDGAGFDVEGVLRRRHLVPFVLVPREVAARHGATDRLSMLQHLQQAQEAFVYGAPFAALALMRSIVEAVLRDHYGAEGRDLSERISSVRSRLPPGASMESLHRLRKLANAILHLDPGKGEGIPKMDDVRLEKEVLSLLFVTRALIEGEKGASPPRRDHRG